ncbi:GNAT family N-acetyltransferase [Vibrio sp. Isolate25]|uniref:GNAT family N-acetyltransferase n=1 Tax=Vibrio sp. Isolate25 TaxID=2908535 RepID=UPI001EFDEA59|nr:GNAT family N-acetyltransferase [Vibrio sp. Isolate25]MCG9599256.1 GNAT family N-acetyltransferase [Vibrio sp. Isolate25]
MNDAEFRSYRSYSNKFRGLELAQANYVSSEDGIRLANIELDECLPQGLDTPNNVLLSLEAKTQKGKSQIGYFWYGSNSDNVFIYDFQVFPEFQGKGYGQKVFQILKEQWFSTGVVQVELLVAYENDRAFKLYQELGFQATGINMLCK